MKDEDSTVRYWGAVGCLVLGEKAAPVKEYLYDLLDDASPNVRLVAAETVCRLGHPDRGLPVLKEAMDHENEYVRIHAANALDNLDEIALPLFEFIKQKINDKSNYI